MSIGLCPKKGKKNPGERSNSGERRNRRNMIPHWSADYTTTYNEKGYKKITKK